MMSTATREEIYAALPKTSNVQLMARAFTEDMNDRNSARAFADALYEGGAASMFRAWRWIATLRWPWRSAVRHCNALTLLNERSARGIAARARIRAGVERPRLGAREIILLEGRLEPSAWRVPSNIAALLPARMFEKLRVYLLDFSNHNAGERWRICVGSCWVMRHCL